MVALCLSIFHSIPRFNKIKQIFLSPFIFTQMEKDEEDSDDIAGLIAGKLEINKTIAAITSATMMNWVLV